MCIGIFLMFTPGIFGVSIEKPIADINHLGGALIIVISVISMGEVLRRGRYLNLLLGLALAIAPWLTGDIQTGVAITDLLAGLILIVIAFPRGPKKETYGLWDKYVT